MISPEERTLVYILSLWQILYEETKLTSVSVNLWRCTLSSAVIRCSATDFSCSVRLAWHLQRTAGVHVQHGDTGRGLRLLRWAAAYLTARYTSAWQGSNTAATTSAAAPLSGHILLRLCPHSYVDTWVTAGRWLRVHTPRQNKTWQSRTERLPVHMYMCVYVCVCTCVCVLGLVCFHAGGL